LRQLQQHWHDLPAAEGALYFPWLRDARSRHAWIPPCGHVAGIYSRTDSRIGVHKAPANEIVEGAVDLQVRLGDADQGALNEAGINCLRALPGRGIRVWGARTLNGLDDAKYVNVRRLFLTLVRRITHSLRDLVFEPNDPSLWDRIRGRLNGFCYDLFESGALQGSSGAEAFFVKCDAETNPREEMEAGRVIAHIGLAAISPAEFIVVRMAHSAAGAMLATPAEFQERR
jgi:phage tail sheath protein FI